MNLALNDSTDNAYAARDGDSIHASLSWINNTASSISNASISVKLSGEALDKTSVSVTDGGYYDSSTNTITWDKKTTQALEQVKTGDTGRMSFNFVVKNVDKGLPQVNIDASAEGDRVSESNVPDQVNSTVSKVVKITSDLRLASKAIYFSGPFENSGPIPPKADNTTTYTIVWTVTNTKSNISNAQVKATLPSYVSWNNAVSPSSENITYDSVSGDVVWNLGNVSAGAGFGESKREVSFQVSLKPSITQVGSSPVIISSQTLSGVDNFAEAEVKDVRNPLTTHLSNDPNFSENDDKVQR